MVRKNNSPLELRDWAVRAMLDSLGPHDSEWAAIR